MNYSYEFAQPEFYIRHVLIQHDANGKGTISFARREDAKDLIEPIEVAPAALERIVSLWKSLNFLDSDENYQSMKINFRQIYQKCMSNLLVAARSINPEIHGFLKAWCAGRT